jgi:hypothetical protein
MTKACGATKAQPPKKTSEKNAKQNRKMALTKAFQRLGG